MAKTKKYSEYLRRRAVEEVLERAGGIPDVARQFGIGSDQTLRNWISQARAVDTNPAPSRAEVSFGPLNIFYDSSVITPRPWTFAQSQWAVEAAATLSAGPILELCCGAGHIGLAVAALTGRSLVQIDASKPACELARVNARHAGLSAVVEVRHGLLLESIERAERFPLILADPPYIPSASVAASSDPAHAIDGGTDGLDLVTECYAIGVQHLLQGGLFSLQLAGDGQWQRLSSRVPRALRFVARRSYGRDRAIVHLTR